jgi:hypothetical protein
MTYTGYVLFVRVRAPAIRHQCRTSRLAANRCQGPQRDVPTLDVCGLKIVVRVTLSRFTAVDSCPSLREINLGS